MRSNGEITPEIREIIKRYAEVPLEFSGYYKYTFYFSGVAPDGARLKAEFGGDRDDIYRYSLDADDKHFLGENPEEEWVAYSIALPGETVASIDFEQYW